MYLKSISPPMTWHTRIVPATIQKTKRGIGDRGEIDSAEKKRIYCTMPIFEGNGRLVREQVCRPQVWHQPENRGDTMSCRAFSGEKGLTGSFDSYRSITFTAWHPHFVSGFS